MKQDRFTTLDIDNAEQLEHGAQARERRKKDLDRAALLSGMNILQNDIVKLLLDRKATPKEAKGALKAVVAMYDALPYTLED